MRDRFTREAFLYRAGLLKYNIGRLFARHPGRQCILAIDSDIGRDGQYPQIMGLYTALDRLKELVGSEGKPMFPGLKIIRAGGSSGKLSGEVKDMMEEIKKDEGTIAPEDVFMVVREENLSSGCFDGFRGSAWMTAIDDSDAGEYVYLPVIEAALLTMLVALDADVDKIRRFHDSFSDILFDPSDLDRISRTRMIDVILLRALPGDMNRLKDSYDALSEILLAA